MFVFCSVMLPLGDLYVCLLASTVLLLNHLHPQFYSLVLFPFQQDYEHELICHTEREKFVVPVHAIGARAILDFPDDVHFPTCAVKYPNSRTLLIRNIGNRDAKFTLETEKYVFCFGFWSLFVCFVIFSVCNSIIMEHIFSSVNLLPLCFPFLPQN